MLKIFCVYDSKAKAHLPPFFLPQTAQGERAFSDCVNSESHQFGAHPGDYTLTELGEFDESTAVITPYDKPVILGMGNAYLVEKIPEAVTPAPTVAEMREQLG